MSAVRWKLRQMMADRRITSKALAKAVGVHKNTVSRWKDCDEMPKIDAEELKSICRVLECQLYPDLIEWLPDDT
ncbi:MAG: helix-turn-helix transcriptional regulator [Rhizonema sp. PD37]|nr:helix-turn-helix transcriptional regulator [Rhizonema sp. PD37]